MDPYTAAINAGLSPQLAAYMPRYVQIESGGNPNAQTGSYSGLLQMGPDEQANYGGNGLNSGAKMYADKANWFSGKYGRAPTPTELYMANQQGEGGLQAHLSNPDAPAWQNMYSTAEGQKKGPGWAKQAIWGNVPTDVRSQFPNGVDGLTSQQFMDLWKSKVERTPMNAAFNNQGQANPMPAQNPMAAAFAGNPQADPSQSTGGIMNTMFPGGSLANVGDALAGAGAGLISINNPMGGAMLQNAVTQRRMGLKPQWGVIGQDMLGQPKYGWINPYNQSVTPYSGASGSTDGSGGTDAAAMIGKISAAQANGATPEEALKQVPPEVAPYVQALIKGNALPLNMSRGPERTRLMAIAHAVDPNLDENSYAMRTQFAKNMGMTSTQSYGGQVQSANTIVAHLDSAYKNLNVLQSGLLGDTDTLSIFNPAKQFVRDQTGSQDYKDASSRYGTASKGIADELEKLLSGSQGAESSKQYWLKKFDPANGPTAVAGALDEARSLMMGRLAAIAHAKELAYGTPTDPTSLLSKDAAAAVPRIAGGQFTYQGASSGTPSGAPPAAPQAPVSTKIGGKTYHKIGNTWYEE